MQLVMEQWKRYVESVEYDKKTVILYEELLSIQEGTYGDLLQLLESNQYLLNEELLDFLRTNAKKAISTAALLGVLFSSAPASARDYTDAEKAVGRDISTLLTQGGDYDAMETIKVADIVAQNAEGASREEKDTAKHMLINSDAFKKKKLEKEDLPDILGVLTGLINIAGDPDLPGQAEKSDTDTKELGVSPSRNNYRAQIYANAGGENGFSADLLKKARDAHHITADEAAKLERHKGKANRAKAVKDILYPSR